MLLGESSAEPPAGKPGKSQRNADPYHPRGSNKLHDGKLEGRFLQGHIRQEDLGLNYLLATSASKA